MGNCVDEANKELVSRALRRTHRHMPTRTDGAVICKACHLDERALWWCAAQGFHSRDVMSRVFIPKHSAHHALFWLRSRPRRSAPRTKFNINVKWTQIDICAIEWNTQWRPPSGGGEVSFAFDGLMASWKTQLSTRPQSMLKYMCIVRGEHPHSPKVAFRIWVAYQTCMTSASRTWAPPLRIPWWRPKHRHSVVD